MTPSCCIDIQIHLFYAHQLLWRQLPCIQTLRLALQQNLAHHLARPRRITDTPARMSTRHIDALFPRDGTDERRTPGREGKETSLFGLDDGVGVLV